MQLGIRAKLTFAIASLIVLIAGFFALYFPAQQEKAARNALHAHASSITLALSTSMAPLIGGDTDQVRRMLEKFATHPRNADIAYIVIMRPNGDVFARYLAPGTSESVLPQELPRIDGLDVVTYNGYLRASHAIVQQRDGAEEFAGVMCAGMSQKSVDAALARSRLSAVVVSALILGVGIVMAWLVGRSIATPLLSAAKSLDEVSSTLVAAARDQEASSAEEAAAVAQTRRSMETLLDSAQQIADRSSEVLGNAERSTNGSRQIAERISNLNELSEKVADILAIIMQVADKADLLALNASLEGTRAGEAGKGFALVASEMRRLAENVMESVAGIRELMKDMRDASQSAVVASEEGTKSSTATTHSAREIALLTQEQRQATEQVMASMDEMGEILNHTLDGIQRTTASANQLTQLAQTLSHIVNPATVRNRRESRGPGSGAR